MFIVIVNLVLFTFFKTYADMRLVRHLMSYESVSEGKGILVSTERRKSVGHQLPTLRDTATFLMQCRTLLLARECVRVKFYTF